MARQGAQSLVPSGQAALLLREACAAGALLVLRVDAGPPVTVRIHDLLPNGALVTEAPISDEVRARMKAASQIAVEYVIEGVQHAFTTRFSGIVPRGTGEAMLLDAPRSLFRIQRRRFFRVAAAAGSAVLIRFGGVERSRQIVNVSAGGIALKLRYQTDEDLVEQLALDGLELRIPGEDTLVTTGVVRYVQVRRTAHGGQRQCGVELTRLSARDQERLMRHAIRRERELIGHRHLVRPRPAHGTVMVLPRRGGGARVRRVISVGSSSAVIALDPEVDRDLSRGQRIPAAELRLVDEEAVLATAVVGAIKPTGEEIHCSLELRDLPAPEQERLSRYARLTIWGTLRGDE